MKVPCKSSSTWKILPGLPSLVYIQLELGCKPDVAQMRQGHSGPFAGSTCGVTIGSIDRTRKLEAVCLSDSFILFAPYLIPSVSNHGRADTIGNWSFKGCCNLQRHESQTAIANANLVFSSRSKFSE